jgi:hypothetical protein
MAMCRLPTAESDGRANLHQGAIGAGIAIASGRATHATCHNDIVTHHVDTQAPIVGFQVPAWDEVLALAVRAAEISGLGYVGVDVVVDLEHGPLLLELNARPGLAIQIANNEGLLSRLRRAEPAGGDAVVMERAAAHRPRAVLSAALFLLAPVAAAAATPSRWEVTVAIRITGGTGAPMAVRLALPADTPTQRVGDVEVTARGLDADVVRQGDARTSCCAASSRARAVWRCATRCSGRAIWPRFPPWNRCRCRRPISCPSSARARSFSRAPFWCATSSRPTSPRGSVRPATGI